MAMLFDSFWRAVLYCLHPRVIALSFVPLALMVALAFGLSYFYWEPGLVWMRAALEASTVLSTLWGWMQRMGVGGVKDFLAPLLLVLAVTPAIVVVALLVVSALMTPALTALVSERRFPSLERKKGGSFVGSVLRSIGVTLLAIVALVVSMPLWLVPPLVLVLPPLIWGWLTYRVMSFDALSDHASADERRELLKRHRLPLLGIGVLTGYLGAAPGIVWASGTLFAAAFVVLVPVAIWIYTLVFAFSSLWFAHYCLDALRRLRLEEPPPSQFPPSQFPSSQLPPTPGPTPPPAAGPRFPPAVDVEDVTPKNKPVGSADDFPHRPPGV